jgi:hypothetical protein
MNQGTPAISLKAFWDAVEQRLSAYSADDLRAILRAIAQQAPPSARQEFLARLTGKPGTGVRPLTGRIGPAYDRAKAPLRELRDLAGAQGRPPEFQARLAGLQAQHARSRASQKRLQRLR